MIGGREWKRSKFDACMSAWTEARFALSSSQQVSGWRMGCFATYTVAGREWTHLVHVPTGKSIYLFETRDLARQAADVLAGLADWSESVPTDLDGIMNGILEAGFYPSGAFDAAGNHVLSWCRGAVSAGWHKPA